jgi:hypothetical protein
VSDLITTTYPATFHEVGYLRAEREHRPWYLVKRPGTDEVGITAELDDEDEIISTYEEG